MTTDDKTEEWTYWEDKAVDPPKQRRDFQTTRIDQNHEKSMGAGPISHKQYGSGNPVKPKHKEFAVDTLLVNVRLLWSVQRRIALIFKCAIQ